MPHHRKRVIFLSRLGDAVVLHHDFANAHKLLSTDSDDELEDEEVVSKKS